MGANQMGEFCKAAVRINTAGAKVKNNAGVRAAKILKISDDAGKPVELASNNAIFGAGREFGGGVGVFNQRKGERPAFVIQNSAEGGSITGASRGNGNVKEIKGGSAACECEGKGGGGECL